MHIAAELGDTAIAQTLIDSGADIDALNRQGNTPLHLAAIEGKIEIAKLLINCGANIKAINCFGSTPMHLAVPCGGSAMAELFIKYGADIDAQDTWGNTALSRAIMYGASEIQEFLVKKGAGISEALNFFPSSPITQYISTVDKMVDLKDLSPDDITNLKTLYIYPDHGILLSRYSVKLESKIKAENYSDYLSSLEQWSNKNNIPKEIYTAIYNQVEQEYHSYATDSMLEKSLVVTDPLSEESVGVHSLSGVDSSVDA